MAIYRGTGGASDSTDDSTISAVTVQAGIATTKASEAASSAAEASTSATNAAASAAAASGHASTSSDNATASASARNTSVYAASSSANSAQAASGYAQAAAASATLANSTEVQAVAAKTTEITGVYNDIANVNTVAGNIADVSTVATNSSNITAVAGDASDIGTVAGSITNVNTVGDNIASVNTVASNNTNINTVAADASDIGTVAGISGNVTTVAGISSDVTTVAGLEPKLDTVIADAADIGTVAGNIGDVSTVAGISGDVDTVAGISADVTSVADNMTAVQNATTSATNAASSAASASDSASAAATSAGAANSSASSASTSETNSANSATAASNSATAASASKDAAASSAVSAGTAATNAAASAVSASASSVSASNSETAAAGSAGTALLKAAESAASAVESADSAADSSNAASTWSNYYNTYVGASSSEPTVDVQGNALVAGALYFNTTNNTTYVWTGSAWNAVANNNIINPNVALTQDLATNGNDVKFGDNDKATFGAGDDLQIFHNGTESFIREVGEGGLKIDSNGPEITLRVNATENALMAESNGAVTAYYNNVAKLATTATGIDVTGTATMDGLVVSGTSGNSITQTHTDGNVVNFTQTGTGGTIDWRNANGGALIRTGDASRLLVGSNGDISFYEDTGTTAKFFWDASAEMLTTSNLTVDGTANFNSNNVVHTAATPNYVLSESDVTDENTQFLQASGTLRIRTVDDSGSNVAERMRIDHGTGDISFYEDTGTTPKLFWDASAESLGIGTNPSSYGNTIVADQGGNYTGFNDQAGLLIRASSGTTGDGQHHGAISFSRGTGQAAISGVQEGSDADVLGLAFWTHSSGTGSAAAEERMRITSDGEIRTSNAVIVGRIADRQAQTVGVTDATIVLAGNSSASGAGEEIGKVAFYNQDSSGFGHNLAATIKALTNTAIGAKADLVFSTKQGAAEGAEALETMRIDSTGRVGIGTSSPASTLEIAKNDKTNGATLSITNTYNSGDYNAGDVVGTINFRTDDVSTTQPIRGQIKLFEDTASGTTYANSNAMSFSTGLNNVLNERMRIDSAGRVGVGTSSPTRPLTVNGNNGTGMIINDAANDKALRFRATGDAFYIEATNNAESAYANIALAGNVGIGTSSPVSALDVTGAGTFGALSSKIKVGLNGDSISSDADFYIQTSTANPLILRTNFTERMRIDSAGHAIIPNGVTLGTAVGVYNAANTLDDYEEGTWTPVLGGGATATNMTGIYTKVGRLVTVTLALDASTITGTPNHIITGLPFANGAKRSSFSVTYLNTFNVACETVGGIVQGSTSQLEFLGMIQGGNWVVANLTAGGSRYVHVTASYHTT